MVQGHAGSDDVCLPAQHVMYGLMHGLLCSRVLCSVHLPMLTMIGVCMFVVLLVGRLKCAAERCETATCQAGGTGLQLTASFDGP